MKKATKFELLQDIHQKIHKDYEFYSKNMMLDEPKPGYEDAWGRSLQQLRLLEGLIEKCRPEKATI